VEIKTSNKYDMLNLLEDSLHLFYWPSSLYFLSSLRDVLRNVFARGWMTLFIVPIKGSIDKCWMRRM
jgi:hypothetical protein